MTSLTCRDESWGKIEYDSTSDEFCTYSANQGVRPVIDRPISVGCLVTPKCNLRCEFCYGNDEALPADELEPAQWRRIFEKLSSWGVLRVDISGGEPTLRGDLSQIIQHGLDTGLNVVVSTNGMVLSKRGPAAFPRTRWHVSLDSGFASIHEKSRLLPTLNPSVSSFKRTMEFLNQCINERLPLRVMTCVGRHNADGLFALAEHLALVGVVEWNISRVLNAGRAQLSYLQRWQVDDEHVLQQIHDLRAAFPFMRIRYSSRTEQEGYFLLVLPDGSLATQFTDSRDKVILGKTLALTLDDLRRNSNFSLAKHGEKLILGHLQGPPASPIHPTLAKPSLETVPGRS